MILIDLYKYCVKHKWELGFVTTPIEDVLKGKDIEVEWVKHTFKDRWFADPFILRVTDKEIVLLVEEFYDPINKGRISKLVISRETYLITENRLVLELDCHLSFPAIIRHDDDVYIYPESSNNKNLILYQYFEKENKCVKIQNLINQPLTDAVVHEFNGNPILFSTRIPEQNGKILRIFKLSESGLYEEFACTHFDENIARMAGSFFLVEGRLYRPSQESNNDIYGHSISIQKVDYTEEYINFNEVIRLKSPHKVHKLGFHTFNVYDGQIVIDVKGFRHPTIGRFCYLLKKIFGYK